MLKRFLALSLTIATLFVFSSCILEPRREEETTTEPATEFIPETEPMTEWPSEWYTEDPTMPEQPVAPYNNNVQQPRSGGSASKTATKSTPAQTPAQTNNGCNHDWVYSTKPCVEPAVCSKCGMTKPNSLTKHNWAEANCHDPRTCRACGKTEGAINPNNHVYVKTNGGYFCKYCGKENPNKSQGVNVENRPTSTTEPPKDTPTTPVSPTTPISPTTPVTPETPKNDPPKEDTPKDETPKEDTPKDETPKDETPKEDTPKDETPKDNTPENPGGFATPVGSDSGSD